MVEPSVAIRLRGLTRAGIYRQTLAGNLGLAAAGLLNRV